MTWSSYESWPSAIQMKDWLRQPCQDRFCFSNFVSIQEKNFSWGRPLEQSESETDGFIATNRLSNIIHKSVFQHFLCWYYFGYGWFWYVLDPCRHEPTAMTMNRDSLVVNVDAVTQGYSDVSEIINLHENSLQICNHRPAPCQAMPLICWFKQQNPILIKQQNPILIRIMYIIIIIIQ
jgi:hypothetical protein